MRLEYREEVDKKIVIDCRDVVKSFATPAGIQQVLGGISLSVAENEFVVLLGPGQCGKTTMINIIAGLDMPDGGQVVVNDRPVAGPSPERGVVYQTIALFPWMTTMGNVEYGPRMSGVPKKERRTRAQKYINLVGLDGFENVYPVELSGGMKQRVGIARAYCNEPVVMLMDEPFGALDAQTRYLMQKELEQIWLRERRSVVFVTNNIEEAVYLADRVVIMSNSPSVIIQEITIDLPRPRNYTSPEFLQLREEIAAVSDITR